jgi:hypothetical protein
MIHDNRHDDNRHGGKSKRRNLRLALAALGTLGTWARVLVELMRH